MSFVKKNEIIAILEDWNPWKKEIYTGIERSYYLSKLKKLIKTNQIITIIGARRSGKSFIMKQFAKYLIDTGTQRNNILIVNFEDPRFADLDAKSLQEIYECYIEFLIPKEMPCILLDEIQEVRAWEKWVRMTHELRKAKIIISGSNAKLLSKELATLLTGRHLDLTIFTLSFDEFLAFNNILIKDKLDIVARRNELKRALRQYIEFGSYPEVVLSSEKKEILLKYFEDIINKDLITRFRVRKPEKLKVLARFYLSNVASPITFTAIEKFLGASADTIERFSDFLETCYLTFFLKRFSFKAKEQEKSPRKVYAIDTGLANVIGFRFTENIGKLAENVVFLELKRRQAANPDMELFYWKDAQAHEVDFVVKNGLKVEQLIQVCWDASSLETKNRELKALIKAMNGFKLNDSIVITEDYEAEEKIKGKKIKFAPLWKWLLE